MKTFLFISFCFFLLSASFAQPSNPPIVDWGHSLCHSYQDLVVDNWGNVYLTGYFQDSVDFDPGPDTLMQYAVAFSDIFIQKLDSQGNLLWIHIIGGPGGGAARSLKIGPDGNLYLAGIFVDSMDFDPGPGTHWRQSNGLANDIFVQKLDTAGNMLWTRSFGGPENDLVFDSEIGPDNGLHLVGSFRDTVDFDPGLGISLHSSSGENDIFVQKFDSLGQLLWVHTFGSPSSDRGNGITIDRLGNVYTAGYFRDSMDADPGPATFQVFSTNDRTMYVNKFTASGQFSWIKIFPTSSPIWGNSEAGPLLIDSKDLLIISGYFNGMIDLDPGPGLDQYASYYTDGFLLALDSLGNYAWANHHQARIARDLELDRLGDVYVTGNYSASGRLSADSLGNPPPQGISHVNSMYLTKLSPPGDELWHYVFTQSDEETVGRAISVQPNGKITTIGYIYGGFDFDPGPGFFYLSGGCDDYQSSGTYLMQYEQCPTGLEAEVFVQQDTLTCESSYISPSGNHVWTVAGTYQDTVQTLCNKLIYTINLGFLTSTDTLLSIQTCEPYALNGLSYESSGIHTQTLFNHLGCDSLITLDLQIESTDLSVELIGDSLFTQAPGDQFQWLDCNDGFALIQGATTPSFVPAQAGSYAVLIENGLCIDTSACVEFLAVGFDSDFLSSLRYYPNPNSGQLTIELGAMYQEIEVQIWNAKGQLVSEEMGKQTEILHMTLPNQAGIYLVQVQADGRSGSWKVLRR